MMAVLTKVGPRETPRETPASFPPVEPRVRAVLLVGAGDHDISLKAATWMVSAGCLKRSVGDRSTGTNVSRCIGGGGAHNRYRYG